MITNCENFPYTIELAQQIVNALKVLSFMVQDNMWNYHILYVPYNRNRPRKKSFANYLLCHSSGENFCDSGTLIYKNSGRDKKCKKTIANASRFAKFMNFSSADNSRYTVHAVCIVMKFLSLTVYGIPCTYMLYFYVFMSLSISLSHTIFIIYIMFTFCMLNKCLCKFNEN